MAGNVIRHEGVGVAFSGGGFRSYSEVAAIEDMERHDVRIAAAAGTSMGSIVAALVAGGLPSQRIEELLVDMDDRIVKEGIVSNLRLKAFNVFTEHGIIPTSTMEREARTTLERAGLRTFADLRMPLAICACDIMTGRLVVFTNDAQLFENEEATWECVAGDLDIAKCVVASASYPLVIEPTEYLGRTFIDGGARMNLPTPLFDRAAFDGIVGVGMTRDLDPVDSLDPASIALRTIQMGANQLELISSHAADVYVGLPVSGDNAFQAGTGRQVIAEARAMIAANPPDWSPVRPSAADAVGRIIADNVSKLLRAAAPSK
ncbi:MAG: patatin-like phospholipase family protein [Atopobiaceae bacterium]|nr:patatin-like phospholipase family protein [Atopobiaceae bacterium]MCH4120175.1 patatin-like phospholipase family protein [Atopobiaceae bacterium]MCI1318586.1 patatin-like phospholipase family protein [Atopobiaceae bacterium]MCI1389244.1 patatin-like phospholipase family protein [Atopobiaceae bacterium]MCI1432745.1 patatin-like phospholipase family protein [Atopobiaceae bacterium]